MGVHVMKFGGTSVGDSGLIRQAAQRIGAVRATGDQVVVIVSAMGHTTDHLIEMSKSISENPSKREMDMLLATGEQVSIALLAMALQEQGIPAVSYTGAQAGIRTSGAFSRARIQTIDPAVIRRDLEAGRVVVVAGFQGESEDGSITTLGRGGSDTTAVALAAATQADICDIFTDVDGVYTADPRIVPEARKLDRISYDEMLELAVLGAGVMHARAVQFGQQYGVPIHVRHSRTLDEGTIITRESPAMEQAAVIGCALKENLGRVSLRDLPNRPGIDAMIFNALADAEINVDDIIQNELSSQRISISFTVDHGDLSDVKPAMEHVLGELGEGELSIDVGLSKVSVVGSGMRHQTGVAATMFSALGDANINIFNITTSEIKISCIINRTDGPVALRAVHTAFRLGTDRHAAGSDHLKPVGSTVSGSKASSN